MNKKRMCIVMIILFVGVVFLTGVFADTYGIRKKRKKPHEFGNVIINNNSQTRGIAPVVFKHWLHRSKYTCRVCHVDIGFGMQANSTEITSKENRAGFYCGTCHNGDTAFAITKGEGLTRDKDNCYFCHSYKRKVKFKNEFYEFKSKFEKERFGNGIDWLDAEKHGLKLIDFIEGVSIKRDPLKDPKNLNLRALESEMPNIIFSHKKHAVWSGCELCHPEIFGVKAGTTEYSMEDIFSGRYCGACHGSVAFPNIDCQRCHTSEVF
jgi:c(7)-type cytochrome triheme protein